MNQEIQDKLRAEVLLTQQKNGDQIDFECLHEMTYMDAVIAGKTHHIFVLHGLSCRLITFGGVNLKIIAVMMFRNIAKISSTSSCISAMY